MYRQDYPGISERIKAIYIDFAVTIGLMIVFTNIISSYPDTPLWLKITLFAVVVVLYEPLFTSLFGGTIGHRSVGIRVKRERDETKNIQFHVAVIRYIIKCFLGILSFITISNNYKGSAIHDIVCSSVVIYHQKQESES